MPHGSTALDVRVTWGWQDTTPIHTIEIEKVKGADEDSDVYKAWSPNVPDITPFESNDRSEAIEGMQRRLWTYMGTDDVAQANATK